MKVRGLFIAPSQLKKIQETFKDVKIQLLVERISHEDILTIRMEPRADSINTIPMEEKFRKLFKDICTVKIDRMEHVHKGTLEEGGKLIIDERTWQ